MIILGLGSNLGNRLLNLRQALHSLENSTVIRVERCAPIYVSQACLDSGAPNAWDQPFLNTAIGCTTTLSPLELLHFLKSIEQQMGRITLGHWSPRIIDIDILSWDEKIIEQAHLQIPHDALLQRPFALWPLADLEPHWVHPKTGTTAAELIQAWGSRFGDHAPSHTKQIHQTLSGTKLVGVLNITPHSFSDGGLFNTTEKALKQLQQLVLQGAEIIDIGAESTSQHIWTTPATAITSAMEWQCLSPLLTALPRACAHLPVKPLISIDTRHATTARLCLDQGVDWINDVTALDDPQMQQLTRDFPEASWVIMHHLGVPPRPNQHLPREKDAVTTIKQWAEARLAHLIAHGTSPDKIILDPGIGFGKTVEQCIEILCRMQEFRSLGLPLFIGHSRKSCLSRFTMQPAIKRDEITLMISQGLMQQNIDYLRVHNVAAHGELLGWHTQHFPRYMK